MDPSPSGFLLTFWQQIQPADLWLLSHINQDWSNAFLDAILPLFRETLFWMPLYLFLLVFVTYNFGSRGWWWVLAGILTAALSDLISSQVIKTSIFRIRPCQDPFVATRIRFLVNYCPQSSSFTSSHATTYFAQALFFYITLKKIIPGTGLFFGWAFLIAYTQVYVGVHYPFDVFCGALLGCGIGWITARLYQNRAGQLGKI